MLLLAYKLLRNKLKGCFHSRIKFTCPSRIILFCMIGSRRMAGSGDGVGTRQMCLVLGGSLEKLKKIHHQS